MTNPARRCPPIELAKTTTDDDGPKWVQVARAGTYKGYAGGELEFTLDANVFASVIANLRRHPSYRRGANGYGSAPTLAWDFHHASEAPPTSGSIPSTGAPAQGWVLDLEVRAGGRELWALTSWLEPAKTYIREGRYQWASISIVFDSIDPVSGQHMGPTLTSIALTNNPFIEGMQPLAASRSFHQDPHMSDSKILAAQLEQFPGTTLVQRAMAYIRAQPNGARAPLEQVWPAACELVRKMRAEQCSGTVQLADSAAPGERPTATPGNPASAFQRVDEWRSMAAGLLAGLTDGEADQLAALVVSVAAAAESAAREGKDWSSVNTSLFPMYVPARMRDAGATRRVESAMRELFDRELAAYRHTISDRGSVPSGASASVARTTIDLAQYPGRNKSERARAYVRSIPGNERLGLEEQCKLAWTLMQRPDVVDSTP